MTRRHDEQVAINEARFREVNEAIERGLRERGQQHGFVCECGRLGCNEIIEMSHADYESVRSSPRRFLVADGHEAPLDETLERRSGYRVVRKVGPAGDVAEAVDPRDERDDPS